MKTLAMIVTKDNRRRASRTWRCSFLLLIILITCAGRVVAQEEANAIPSDFNELDRFIQQEMALSHIPGIALTIFSESGVLHQGNYGTSDSSGRAVTAQTPFVIGSLSKMITAYAVLQLTDDGQLSLDAPVHQYLPWFKPINPFNEAPITVRHLISHTSGISALDGIDFRSQYAQYSLDELLHTYEQLQLNRPVGDSYQYSNVNYNLLGGVIQQVTGQAYAEHIKSNIFVRLNMDHSYTSLPEAASDGLAQGHQLWFRRPKARSTYPFVDSFLPSMTLMLSSEDVAKFLMATLTNRSIANGPVLSEEAAAAFYQPLVKAYLDEFTGEYAFGSLITKLHGRKVIFCQGGYNSFRAYVFIMPEAHVGFAIMMNMNTGYSDQGLTTISRNVLSYLSGSTLTPTRPDPEYYIWLAIPISVLLIEAIRIIVAIIAMKRWNRVAPAQTKKARRLLLSLLLPLLLDLAVITAFLYLLPHSLGIPLSTMMFVQPDLTIFVYVICAVFAAFALIRTVWGARLLLR